MAQYIHNRVVSLACCVLGIAWGLGTAHAGIACADLAAYWPADGDTLDLSANANHGTLFNGADYGPGVFGDAFVFDGSDDFFAATTDGFPLGSEDRSIAFWVQGPGINDPNRMLAGWGTPATNKMSAVIVGLGNLRTGRPAYWGFQNNFESIQALDPKTWHHIVFTLEGGNLGRLYVDGSSITSQSFATAPNTPAGTEFYLADFIATMNNFAGKIDDVSVAKRALSDEEVIDLFNDGFIGIFRDNFEPDDGCANPSPK